MFSWFIGGTSSQTEARGNGVSPAGTETSTPSIPVGTALGEGGGLESGANPEPPPGETSASASASDIDGDENANADVDGGEVGGGGSGSGQVADVADDLSDLTTEPSLPRRNLGILTSTEIDLDQYEEVDGIEEERDEPQGEGALEGGAHREGRWGGMLSTPPRMIINDAPFSPPTPSDNLQGQPPPPSTVMNPPLLPLLTDFLPLSVIQVSQSLQKTQCITCSGVVLAVISIILGLFLGGFLNDGPNYIDSQAQFRWTQVLSMVTYMCWLTCHYPQVILNFTRGSTLGLNIDMEIWALLENMSFFAYIVGQYERTGDVTYKDSRGSLMLVTACNGLALVVIIIAQCYYFDGPKLQIASSLPLACLSMLFVLSGVYLVVFLNTVADVEPSKSGDRRDKVIDLWTTILYYVSIASSIIKFAPQIIRNRKYKIFIGVDLISIGLQWLGAACLLAAIFFYQDNFTVSFVDSILSKLDSFIKAGGILTLSGSLLGQYMIYYQDPAILGRRIGHEQAYYEYMKTRFLMAMASGRQFAEEEDIDLSVIERHFHRMSMLESQFFGPATQNGDYESIEAGAGLAEGAEMGEDSEDWTCAACAAQNPGHAPVCGACYSQRPNPNSDMGMEAGFSTPNSNRAMARSSVNTAILARHDHIQQEASPVRYESNQPETSTATSSIFGMNWFS